MYDYTNATQFAIKSDVQRYFYGGWLLFVALSSFIGDSLILLAIQQKAFKLHKMIVTFIQHMAVNDLLDSVGNIFPAVLSTFFNTGSPHRFLDYIRFFIAFYSSVLSAALVGALTLGKVLLLKYPFRIGLMSRGQAHKVCLLLWIFCLNVPVLHFSISKEDVIFDYRVYHCLFSYTSEVWKILLPVMSFIMLFLPNTIVVISTAWLLFTAKNAVKDSRRGLKWQGILTVSITALLHTASFLPYNIYFMAEPFVQKDPVNPGPFYIEFYRASSGFMALHVLSNFFVYSLTVASFRDFLLKHIRRMIPAFSNKVSHQGYISVDRFCRFHFNVHNIPKSV